jgi:hypothetical protein
LILTRALVIVRTLPKKFLPTSLFQREAFFPFLKRGARGDFQAHVQIISKPLRPEKYF